MKRLIARAVFLFLLMSVSISGAYADSVFDLSGSATLLWGSLRVIADPGVTITWLPDSESLTNGQSALAVEETAPFYGQVEPHSAQLFQSSATGEVSLNNTLGGFNLAASTSDTAVSASFDWASGIPFSPLVATDSLYSWKQQAFTVSGSGNVTFSMDYTEQVNRSVDASGLPYPIIETAASVETILTLFVPFVITIDNDYEFLPLTDVIGSASDSLMRSGTATVAAHLTNGNTYFLKAETDGFATFAAPEPSALVLLGVGLIGLLGLRHRV